jgi:hypothetical protein
LGDHEDSGDYGDSGGYDDSGDYGDSADSGDSVDSGDSGDSGVSDKVFFQLCDLDFDVDTGRPLFERVRTRLPKC